MRSRTPIVAALAISALAVVIALWSVLGGGDADDTTRAPGEALRAGGGALLKDRPLPGAPLNDSSGQEPNGGKPLPEPPAGGGVANSGQAAGGDSAGGGGLRALAEARAAQRLAASQSRPAGAIEEPANDSPGAISGGVPEEPPPPTFAPGSIYDGLSQDDLLDLYLASRRLRDAGVFQKLTPEQYAQVAQLLPDLQGVQDANEITQRVLGMGVGEWLDHERGPKGRFVLQ